MLEIKIKIILMHAGTKRYKLFTIIKHVLHILKIITIYKININLLRSLLRGSIKIYPVIRGYFLKSREYPLIKLTHNKDI